MLAIILIGLAAYTLIDIKNLKLEIKSIEFLNSLDYDKKINADKTIKNLSILKLVTIGICLFLVIMFY